MPVVPKNESGVPLKWKNHFPLKFVTSPPSGTGVSRKPKQTLLYDKFGSLLGTFERREDAEAEAIRIQDNPDVLTKLI